MSNEKTSSSNLKNWFPVIVIVLAAVAAYLIYSQVLGNKTNFINEDPENQPISEGFKSYLGTIYKGGIIVPLLLTMLLLVFIFTIERFMTIMKSSGTGPVDAFLRKVKGHLASNNLDAALAECNKQKGSVGNVVFEGISKYKQVWGDTTMNKEQKQIAIKEEIEEATSLELPMLQRNLSIIATIASIATLMGLLGTVIGMIRAFHALAQAGAPDAIALSTGISEALINTAFGIGTSALAIVFYNLFTTKIDVLTYRIDEAGFSINQSFATSYTDGK